MRILDPIKDKDEIDQLRITIGPMLDQIGENAVVQIGDNGEVSVHDPNVMLPVFKYTGTVGGRDTIGANPAPDESAPSYFDQFEQYAPRDK